MKSGLAINTRLCYASAWKHFGIWCARAERVQLPALPSTVEDFAAWCIGEEFRLRTVTIRLNAIAHYHRQAGLDSPIDSAVRGFMENARRNLKEAPGGKAAVTRFHIAEIAKRLSKTPVEIRNRTMILLNFASGWRRSEITGLEYSDISFVEQGMTLWLRSSKTDQKAKGRLVGIHRGRVALTCPVRAIKEWLAIRGTWDGPLFVRFSPQQQLTREGLSHRGEALYWALKSALEQLGEDPQRFGAHSLRAGMITEAVKHGASEASIKMRTGHRSSESLQLYIRPAKLFDMNPMRAVL
ncbi:MAG: site-specific integrase [Acidobacteriota bacterium]|nr:site-specific integrase [Acidobacteriota bacterium]